MKRARTEAPASNRSPAPANDASPPQSSLASRFRRRRADFLAVAYLLAITLLSYGGALSPGRTFLPADLLLLRAPYSAHVDQLDPGFTSAARPATDPLFQFYPSRKYLRDSLRSDYLPLWNPYTLSGAPFAADDQSAVFYPPNWLYAALGLAAAFGWVAALHTFLAGLFFWLWGRRVGWTQTACLCGATAWMLCGVMVSWQMWQVVDDALCWLPLALFFWEGYARRRSPRCLAGVAAALAMSLLAGHMQFGFYVWLTVFCYALYRRPEGAPASTRAGAVAGAFALGAGIGFVQVAATADMLLRSLRADVPLSAMLQTAMPLNHLVLLLAPDLLGGQRDDVLAGILPQVRYTFGALTVSGHGPYIGNVNYYELTCYCGVAALVFAAYGLNLRQRGDLSRLWVGLSAFALLMGLGTPLFTLFYDFVPLFRSFHGAARILALLDFSVAALCAQGVDRLFRLDAPARKTIALGAGVVLVMLFAAGFRAAATIRTAAVGDTGYLLTHDWIANGHVLRYLCGPMAGMVVACLAAALLGQRYRAAALALVAADMLLFAAGFNGASPAKLLFPQTDQTRRIAQRSGDGRVLCLANARGDYQSRLMPNSAMALGWRDIAGNDPLVLARYDRFLRAINRAQTGQDYPAGLGLVTTVGSPALNLLDLKYVVAPGMSPPAAVNSPGLRLVDAGDLDVYRNVDASGGAWLAGTCVAMPDDASVLDDLAAGKGAVSAPGACALSPAPQEPPQAGPGTASCAWKNGAIDVSARSAGAKVLVVSTPWEPGWRAWLDGRRVRPAIADTLFLATPIPAGDHRLRLRYLPAPVQFGLYISLISIGFSLAFSFRRLL